MATAATPWPSTAFLGLGALGSPMAARLLTAGVPLTVHNRSHQARQRLEVVEEAPASIECAPPATPIRPPRFGEPS